MSLAALILKISFSCKSWAKYVTSKIFITSVESTQHVESINSVLKKHCDQSTFLKELIKTLEQKLEIKLYYTCIRDYYGFNPLSGLLLTYKTIFKDIDLVLIDHLAHTPLSLQQAQMNQALLYQKALITNKQISTKQNFYFYLISTIEHLYDVLQIRLQELLLGILSNEVQETWKICSANVYTSSMKNNINKKHQFGTTMLIAKTSVQIALAENVITELIRVLTQFITKYYCNTSLVELDSNSNHNLIEVSNPKYHKPKGYSPKQLRSFIEENKKSNKQHIIYEQRTYSYCLVKGHNIHGCAQYKKNL
ncbi:16889_t:CDS:2, partial [Cetraspora pellucida]